VVALQDEGYFTENVIGALAYRVYYEAMDVGKWKYRNTVRKQYFCCIEMRSACKYPSLLTAGEHGLSLCQVIGTVSYRI